MPPNNKSPNLDQYITDGRKRYVSYYEGAQIYGMGYSSFVTSCKEAGANKKIRKTVVVDLDRFEEYLEERYEKYGTERVNLHGKGKKKDGSYLLSALFNAPTTMSSYYQSAVNYDFPQYAQAK